MLGERIALLRRGAGWSQAELADRLNISASAVGMYEQGRREPSLDALVALANTFQVSADYLLTGRTLSQMDAETVSRLLKSAAGRERKDRKGSLSRQELEILFTAMLSE